VARGLHCAPRQQVGVNQVAPPPLGREAVITENISFDHAGGWVESEVGLVARIGREIDKVGHERIILGTAHPEWASESWTGCWLGLIEPPFSTLRAGWSETCRKTGFGRF
jgi:hypothetical protein